MNPDDWMTPFDQIRAGRPGNLGPLLLILFLALGAWLSSRPRRP